MSSFKFCIAIHSSIPCLLCRARKKAAYTAVTDRNWNAAGEQGACCDPADPARDFREQGAGCDGPTKWPLDLVSGVLGVQLHTEAPTIQWTSGQHTVLPYAPQEGEDQDTNALKKDLEYVKVLAALPESTPGSDTAMFLSKHDNHTQLLSVSREALSMNKVVVIRGYVDTEGFEFSPEGLYNAFQTSDNLKLDCHGMCGAILYAFVF